MAKQTPGPREVSIAMLWQHGQLCMQDRTHEGKGEIGFFGGKLEPGEEPHDGVIREVWEETEHTMEIDRLKVLDDLVVARRKVHVFTYLLPHKLELVALEGTVIKMPPHQLREINNLTEVARAVQEAYL